VLYKLFIASEVSHSVKNPGVGKKDPPFVGEFSPFGEDFPY
jgi:hypothetical protein